jgi:hypothetical protein
MLTASLLSPPLGSEDKLYNGYYKGWGFKYQLIVSPCGLVEDVAGPYSGREADAEIARRSRLEERLSEFSVVAGLPVRPALLSWLFRRLLILKSPLPPPTPGSFFLLVRRCCIRQPARGSSSAHSTGRS